MADGMSLGRFCKIMGIETGIHYYPNHWLKFFAKKNVRLAGDRKNLRRDIKSAFTSGINFHRSKQGHCGYRRIFYMSKVKE